MRLRMVQHVDEIIVATVDDPSCDPIAEIAQDCGVSVYRGSENDVLDRYYEAARLADAEAVIRVTSDCPLIDPRLIDVMIESWGELHRNCYMAINVNEFARGFDAELFPFSYLEKAWMFAKEQSDREHVTRYMYHHPQEFMIRSLDNDNENIGHYRFCVDTPQDFELIKKLLEKLWPVDPSFSWKGVIRLMKQNSDWFDLNSGVEQKKV